MAVALNETNSSTSLATIVPLDIPVNYKPVPFEHLLFKISFHTVSFIFNCVILVVTVGSRRLRFPRHVYWIAISLANIYTVLIWLLETAAIGFGSQIACQLFVLNAGAGYSSLLVSLCLSAFDRYLSIAKHEWYKKKVTTWIPVIWLGFALGLTYLGVTSPFWTGYKTTATCTVNLTHMHWVIVSNVFWGIVCCVLHILVFLESRTAIRQYNFNLHRVPQTVKFDNGSRRQNKNIQNENSKLKQLFKFSSSNLLMTILLTSKTEQNKVGNTVDRKPQVPARAQETITSTLKVFTITKDQLWRPFSERAVAFLNFIPTLRPIDSNGGLPSAW